MNTLDLENAKQRLAETSKVIQDLSEMIQEARKKDNEARHEVDLLTRYSMELPDKNLTVEALRERIADFAREHKTGETDTPWIMFRAALAELARRAGAKD